MQYNHFHLKYQTKILDNVFNIHLIVLFSSLSNGVYQLRNNDSLEEYQVYCHLTEISGCGLGGWTLVMKIDGNKVKIILYKGIFTEKLSRHT